MQKINRNQAEKIFNNSKVIDTAISQSENNLCLIFDLIDGNHLQINYKQPEGEKSYFLLNRNNILESQ